MTVMEHLSWEEHIRNSHLLILRDAVHNSPQSKERPLPESWHSFKTDRTTKGSKQNTTVFFPTPTEILLKCIINFIRKIFLAVFAKSSAYGDIEKLNDQKDFIS